MGARDGVSPSTVRAGRVYPIIPPTSIAPQMGLAGGGILGGVKPLRLRLDPRSILLAALMLIVVAAVIFGIDLINGRWDQPPIQPPL